MAKKAVTDEIDPDKFCCQELVRAIQYKKSVIRVFHGQASLIIGDNSIEQKEHEDAYKETVGIKPSNLARAYEYHRIMYCPFCGKKLPDDIT